MTAPLLAELVAGRLGDDRAGRLLSGVHVHPSLLAPAGEVATRAVISVALATLLLDDLVDRVPSAAGYVDDTLAGGGRVWLDHGAVRTVGGVDCGGLPSGPAALDRVLSALGYRHRFTYDLARLRMTGRSWCHADLPADIPQYFVSELHADQFSATFGRAAERILASSRDPIDENALVALSELATAGCLPVDRAAALLPTLFACFGRHHDAPRMDDYLTVLSESDEMAWIATEGTVCNHMTDRVADVAAVAGFERAAGRPIKDTVEVSGSGRILQSAHRAATVERTFRTDTGAVLRRVPGSFFEFITRLPLPDGSGPDLAFDAANAQQIFAMTRGPTESRPEAERPAVGPLRAALADIVGPTNVLTDPDVVRSFTVDWTGRWHGHADLVVRPGSTGEVAAVVQACRAAGVALVPQGGNTGLVGGSVPAARTTGAVSPVVLSLVRLQRRDEVDHDAGQVTVGAGVTLAALTAHVAGSGTGLFFPVDIGARQSASIGGMVATNAGGIHFVRYGAMRRQVVGIEAVLPDGGVVSRMAGLAKDNTGYDLAGLFTGSEGTLGVVTAARLRLVPQLAFRVTAVIGVPDTAEAVALVVAMRRELGCLEAAEIYYHHGLELVRRGTDVMNPLGRSWPAYLLVECAGRDDAVVGQLAGFIAGSGIADSATAVATGSGPRRQLWAVREGHADAVSRMGIPHKLDVSLPPATLAAFVPAVHHAIATVSPGAAVVLWGHVGDGNLHINVVGPAADDYGVDDAVFGLAVAMGGGISAEHGIGRAKIRWLHLTRSEADIGAMQAIKRALDPGDLLNPGVLLPGRRDQPG